MMNLSNEARKVYLLMNLTNEELAFELESIARSEELKAYESGDFDSESVHEETAKILHEAVRRIRGIDKKGDHLRWKV